MAAKSLAVYVQSCRTSFLLHLTFKPDLYVGEHLVHGFTPGLVTQLVPLQMQSLAQQAQHL